MSVDRAQLAHRIETGIETKSGRYDLASKVEVKAYVDKQMALLGTAIGKDVGDTEGRLKQENAELAQAVVALHHRLTLLETPWCLRLLNSLRSEEK